MKLTTDKQARKEQPVARGVLDYFPNAVAEIARVSYVGNQQHNPGEPMRWAREKSTDHADCIARHLIERGTIDDDGMRHSAKAAWRALALLQLELEDAAANTQPPVPQDAAWQPADRNAELVVRAKAGEFDYRPDMEAGAPTGDHEYDEAVRIAADLGVNRAEEKTMTLEAATREMTYRTLLRFDCPMPVAKQIAGGVTTPVRDRPELESRWAYIAGPMRGYPEYNFPAFDAARDALREDGYHVISPADIDRNAGDSEGVAEKDLPPQYVFCLRDFFSLYFIRRETRGGAIAMLPGWEKSTGAVGEFFLSRWLGLRILDAESGQTLNPAGIRWDYLMHTVEKYLSQQVVG